MVCTPEHFKVTDKKAAVENLKNFSGTSFNTYIV
jgi:hypothetical protein